MTGMRYDTLARQVAGDIARSVAAVDPDAVGDLVDRLARRKKVVLIGTGRSGAVLRAMAVRLGHLGVDARCVGPDDAPRIAGGEFVLVGSGSGRTAVPLRQAEAARAAGAEIVAITADPASPIAELAGLVIHIPAPAAPADGTPHTLRSLFEECLLVVCDCVCKLLADKLGVSTEEMQRRHAPDR